MSSEEPTEQGVEITDYVGPAGAGQATSVSPEHKADADWPQSTPLRQHEGNGGCLACLVWIGIVCVIANLFLSFYRICFDNCAPRSSWMVPAIAMLAVIGLGANIWGLFKHLVPLSPLPTIALGVIILVSILMDLLFLSLAILCFSVSK